MHLLFDYKIKVLNVKAINFLIDPQDDPLLLYDNIKTIFSNIVCFNY